jgi:hypothetical protein
MIRRCSCDCMCIWSMCCSNLMYLSLEARAIETWGLPSDSYPFIFSVINTL